MISYVNVGDLEAPVVEAFEKGIVILLQFAEDQFERTPDGKRYASATLNIALVGWMGALGHLDESASEIVALQQQLREVEAKLRDVNAAIRGTVSSVVAPGFLSADEVTKMNNRVVSDLFTKHRGASNASELIEQEYPTAYAEAVGHLLVRKLEPSVCQERSGRSHG
jgi:hypothetical protein